MTARFIVTTLDDVDEISSAGGALRWKPVRRTLGVGAFGINAYVAAAGRVVVEDHDEMGAGAGGHEEVYLVVRGAARFTIDGETLEAPTGTLVFLPDPSARRSAVAEADDTLVLAIGGDPRRPYEVSPWESWFAAEPLLQRGDFDGAVDVMREGLPRHEGNPRLHYALACALSLGGRHDEAVGELRRAHDAAPGDVAEWSAGDADLDPLRGRDDYPVG